MPKAKLGGKINDSHTTITEASVLVLEGANKLPEVTKISIGIIKHVGGGGQRRLRFMPITGGVKAIVRGSGSIQELYIYTKNPKDTEAKLQKIFVI